MKQSGNTINPANAQEFIDSSKSAQLGQRQFFTPPGIAAALLGPLSSSRTMAVDFQCGNGVLLEAFAQSTHRHPVVFGADIDARSRRPNNMREQVKSFINPLIDCVKLFPLLVDIGFRSPHILLNPPFSLRWPVADIMPHLCDELATVLRTHTAKDGTADSTIATIIMALTMLTNDGEALIICNGDTARRLYEITPILHGYTWFQLTIDHPIFQEQLTPFPTAALYLSRSHRGAIRDSEATVPHTVKTITSPMAIDITNALSPITQRKSQYHYGHTPSNYATDYYSDTMWLAAVEEHKARESKRKPEYNISLSSNGLISTYLSTYTKLRFDAHDSAALKVLSSMRGKHPAGLVVQAATRRTLLSVVNGGTWTVDPALLAAVNKAVKEYDAVRAPFYTPTPIQCLAYLDEEDTIECINSGLVGLHKGDKCKLSTRTESTDTPSFRFNTVGIREETILRALDLVITIKSTCDEYTHEFVISHNPDLHQDTKNIYYHPVQRLIEHFKIPRPASVSETNPDQYQKNLAAMDRIEAMINS